MNTREEGSIQGKRGSVYKGREGREEVYTREEREERKCIQGKRGSEYKGRKKVNTREERK